MAYETKVGEGTLWPTESNNDRAPALKGSIVLPDGTVLGIAAWEKRTNAGKRFLSISVDDKEGAYQAKQLGREQTTLGDAQPARQEPRERSRQDDPARDRFARGGRDERPSSRHQDQLGGSRHSQRDDRREHSPDLDDEIPW